MSDKPNYSDLERMVELGRSLRNAEKKRYSAGIKDLQASIDIQGANGNWNHDPYMHGMLNGMLFAMSVVGDRRYPQYRDQPKRWGSVGARWGSVVSNIVDNIDRFIDRYFTNNKTIEDKNDD